MIEEDGAYYWTLAGEPMTDGAGNKLPVAVAPGVRVNAQTDEWEVSPDGGKTWLGTGITAREGASLFTKIEEDEGFVYFTLGDGTQLKVARSTDFRCKMLSGKQYFAAGETRIVKIDMSDVKKSTITKPDGWKAVIDNGELKITAPAEENTYAEQSGKVAVVAVASNGQSSISEVAVEVGAAPHVLTIDEDLNVKITVDPDLVDDYSYDGFYYGVRKLDEFVPEQVLRDIEMDDRTFPVKETIETSIAGMLGAEPEKGVSYVVYVVDQYWKDGDSQLDDAQNMIYAVAQSIFVKFETTNLTYENAQLSVEAMGVAQCWAGVNNTADYTPSQILEDIQDRWNAPAKLPATFDGLLSEYAGGITIVPGKEYTVWVLPVIPGKATATYTEEHFFTLKVSIPDIATGGSATVEIGEVTSGMKKVSATITPGEGVYKYYSAYKTDLEYAALQDNEWIKELVVSGTPTTAPDSYTIEQEGLLPDAKGYFLSVAVSKDGKAGSLVRKSADTSPLVYSTETIVAEATAVGLTGVTISLTAGDNIVSYRYLNKTDADFVYGFPWQGDATIMEKDLALGDPNDPNTPWDMVFAEADKGDLTVDLSELAGGTLYHFFVVGVDKDGLATRMAQVDYTPSIPADKFIRKSDPKWADAANRGQLTNLSYDGTPDTNFSEVRGDVTLGANCAGCWVCVAMDDYATGVGAANKTLAVVSAYDTKYFTESGTSVVLNEFAGTEGSNYIYVVSMDKDGNYYEYETIATPAQ